MLVLAFAFLALLGVALIVVGWRGRRADSLPRCRKCRFILEGLRERRVCPECGRDVSQARSIVMGARRKRAVPLALGLLITGGLVMAGGVVVWLSLREENIHRYKPDWLLVWEARTGLGSDASPVLRELIVRLNANTLSPEDIATVMEAGLGRQANLAAAWVVEWGDFIEGTAALNKLTAAEMQRYWRQTTPIEFHYRRELVRGGPWPVEWRFGSWRGGSSGGVALHMSVTARGEDGTRTLFRSGLLVHRVGPGATSSHAMLQPDLAEGRYALGLDVRYALQLAGSWVSASSLTAWTTEENAELEVTPLTRDSVTKRTTAALDAAVPLLVSIENASYMSMSGERRWIAFEITVQPTPVALGFDVFVRSDGREWFVGRMTAPAREPQPISVRMQGHCGDLARPGSPRVDVILRASSAAARETVDLFEIWDGEIVIRDVSVTPPR